LRTEIKLAGFGGQGVILMGVLLAQAAGYHENKEVAQTQSYGPEARGGACRAEVVISDEPIDYTKTLNPDIFVAMSQPAFDKYIKDINIDTADIFIDDTLVTEVPEGIKKLHRVSATKLAEEKVGNKMVANTIMLTALVNTTKMVSLEALKTTITENLPAKIQAVNMKAVDVALEYCEQQGGKQ
jgi:2-oxoglutarate ferredoxin oxidoreductase subunit gamma